MARNFSFLTFMNETHGNFTNETHVVCAVHANGTLEGGVFSTRNPLATDLSKFLVQAVIIIGLTRLLHAFLRLIRQPRVIAEVIGGICLGPSVLGLIPGFKDTIFPPTSLPLLGLVSNVGLVLYLFLVGLELDPRTFFRDLKRSVAISSAGIVLPFIIGVGVSYGMYNQLLLPYVTCGSAPPFTSFMLFTGVAMAITAFPVLARILTEFKLLSTPVGLMTITAAAVDDVCAWVLLALVICILHAKSQLIALYVFLIALSYTVFLLVPFRLVLQWASDRFISQTRKESVQQLVIALVVLLVFLSGWITELIGIHAIFGAFLMGLAIPRRSSLPHQLTEKIEDLVNIVFLPLYFASSGLKTKLGLLNDGPTWGWLILVIIVACAGKIIGCTLASRSAGIPWRESCTIGVLMNTKGLVELIVLNIGLDAHVINDRIFVIMVVMALVTTFITSPIISVIYPPRLRRELPGVGQTKAAKDLGVPKDDGRMADLDTVNMLIYVDRLQTLPTLVSLVSLFKGNGKLVLHALKIVEVSERSSSVLAEVEASEAHRKDPSLQVASYLGHLLQVPTNTFFTTAPGSLFVDEVNKVVADHNCNLLIIPWHYASVQHIPLELVDMLHSSLLTTCIYYDQQATEDAWFAQNRTFQRGVLVPYMGGKDDREALRIALRMHKHAGVNVCVIHVQQSKSGNALTEKIGLKYKVTPVNPLPAMKIEADSLDTAWLDEAKVAAATGSGASTITFVNVDAAGLVMSKMIAMQSQFDLVITGRSGYAQSDLPTDENIPGERSLSFSTMDSPNLHRNTRRGGFSLRKNSVSKRDAGANPLVFGKVSTKLLQMTSPVLVVYKPLARLASL